MEKSIIKAQKDLNTDIFGFGEYLRMHDYQNWKKNIQPNWERGKKLFANSNVDISVRTELRTFGSTDRTKILRK
ncbi:Ger(x)C family spore germination C-terminal domain-containing protein [Virgibacillus sp. 179-BFC.A HS]|uniref:Ger(X)C family spore germination C-terminal domain-containing protein n=1 Tax=Tigheibacillus jepli TaxID=3035914 RepID=A0ABU5CIR6_9BACI|nr:Ger(x)C family spore germination C-terminal domain-containing protein [Virgibacillus sp. 179-BFC.A HS]MDY0405851.1 Ger(x)C family spore germination C-terminal domain-containing protein [Virgibacillus sp. 179-BFC.A HS]